eukprot:GFKZ01012693.1.p1 GENE.GFKZ01012693.1~~GFKZ01012693.1.p1  ORF type:complete len:474 (-),score=84.52 GFKZ01012693.1:488-1909(-)
MYSRHLCTSDPAQKTLRELKRHIHRLYKHIHPDRLHRYPSQRAVNEASFKTLQSVLQRHYDWFHNPTPPTQPPPPPLPPQQLTFFTHITNSTADPPNPPLNKSVTTLYEANLHSSLHSLFTSLNLPPPPSRLLHSPYSSPTSPSQWTSLSALVKQARRVIPTNLRSARNSPSRPEDEGEILRLSMRRSRGVHVVFGDGLPAPHKLTALLRRLKRTLVEVGEVDLRNLVILVDGGFDVRLDSRGVYPFVVLGACATEERWREGLRSQEVVGACERCVKWFAGMRELEDRVARELGVRLVMHNLEIVNDGVTEGRRVFGEYEEVLKGLAERGGTGKSKDDLQGVAVMMEEGEGVGQDVRRGVLRIGIGNGVEEIIKLVRGMGAEVGREHERIRWEREEERKLVASLKRGLGIERLERGEEVTDWEWKEGLKRLRKGMGRLRGILEGVGLVVGRGVRVLEDGDVEIPFDFDEKFKV